MDAGVLLLYVCIQQPPVVPAIKVRDKRDWFDKRPPKGVDTLGIGIPMSVASHGMSQFAANRFSWGLRIPVDSPHFMWFAHNWPPPGGGQLLKKDSPYRVRGLLMLFVLR